VGGHALQGAVPGTSPAVLADGATLPMLMQAHRFAGCAWHPAHLFWPWSLAALAAVGTQGSEGLASCAWHQAFHFVSWAALAAAGAQGSEGLASCAWHLAFHFVSQAALAAVLPCPTRSGAGRRGSLRMQIHHKNARPTELRAASLHAKPFLIAFGAMRA